jgi:hypothetical protein
LTNCLLFPHGIRLDFIFEDLDGCLYCNFKGPLEEHIPCSLIRQPAWLMERVSRLAGADDLYDGLCAVAVVSSARVAVIFEKHHLAAQIFDHKSLAAGLRVAWISLSDYEKIVHFEV